MGDLLLTDKDATGLVICGVKSGNIRMPRWAAVGKVCSPTEVDDQRHGMRNAKSVGTTRPCPIQGYRGQQIRGQLHMTRNML
jgi:hypothetical protein